MESLGAFRPQYDAAWSAGMRAKLGLPDGLDDAVVAPLVDELLALLQASHVDHTSFFRALGAAARGDAEPARGLFLDLAAFDDWVERWRALGPDADAMDRVNPVYIPRNHLVEEALAAATDGDLDPLERLLDAVTAPVRRAPRPRALRRSRPAGLRRLPDLLRDQALYESLVMLSDSECGQRRDSGRRRMHNSRIVMGEWGALLAPSVRGQGNSCQRHHASAAASAARVRVG